MVVVLQLINLYLSLALNTVITFVAFILSGEMPDSRLVTDMSKRSNN